MDILLKAIAWFFAALPESIALAVGRGLGWIYGNVIRYHRKDAIMAVERGFPDLSSAEVHQLVQRMYGNLGMNIVDMFRLSRLTDVALDEKFELFGGEYIDKALEANKGALMLNAHLGSWEMLAALSPRLGYPLSVVAKDLKGPGVNDYFNSLRSQFGVKVIPAKNAARSCLRALRNNELIGFMLDQNMIDKEGVFVDFFGKPACTTPGLAILSMQSEAPVLPIFIHRTGRGLHQINVYPPVPPPVSREKEDIRAATQEYTRIIEEEIRKYPDQWIWLHRRWRTQPAAAII